MPPLFFLWCASFVGWPWPVTRPLSKTCNSYNRGAKLGTPKYLCHHFHWLSPRICNHNTPAQNGEAKRQEQIFPLRKPGYFYASTSSLQTTTKKRLAKFNSQILKFPTNHVATWQPFRHVTSDLMASRPTFFNFALILGECWCRLRVG